MKTITINVSEPVYREFQEFARRQDRKTSELIREAMELYRERRIAASQNNSIRDADPISVGRIVRPLASDDDLLEEMSNL